jgi:hypothetical protein
MSVLGDNHVVGKCGHEDWADASYPGRYLPSDAIGPDDSYT